MQVASWAKTAPAHSPGKKLAFEGEGKRKKEGKLFTAESVSEDDLLGFEIGVDIAALDGFEAGVGRAPSGWVGDFGHQVGGLAAARKEVEVEGFAGPFHGEGTAADGVEGVAKGVGRGAELRAAQVGQAAASAHGAAGAGVQGIFVGCLEVDSFDDVDLASVWPTAGC